MSGGTTGTLPGAATRTPAGGLGANRFGAVIGVHLSTQLIKEDLRRAQIGRRKAFAEAIVYAREEIACLGCPPLGLPQARETDRRPQFPRQGAVCMRAVESLE
jgi:hypothetical protein